MSLEPVQEIRALEQKIREFPAEIRFYVLLGEQYLLAGQHDQAETIVRTALETDPGNQAAHFLLIEILVRQNRLDLANAAIDRAMQSVAETPELLARASDLRHMAGRLPEAEAFLSRALTLSPCNTRLRFQRGHLLLARSRYAEAIETFSELAEGRFFKDDALAGIAQAYERQGDVEKARHYIERALAHTRNSSAFVLQTLADIACQTGVISNEINLLKDVLKRTGLSRQDQAGLHFSLGRMLDLAGEYGDAFAHIRTANELLAPDYDWRVLGSTCRALIQKFSGDAVAAMPTATVRNDRPVFIVGLPRSGTSLVEHVLAAHPGVYGAGELEHIRCIARDIERATGISDTGPDELARMGTEYLNQCASCYLDCLDGLNIGAKRIIDKMPGNLMYLGLISALFPEARIIHCIRNPLDTCLSCYFQRFHTSNSLAYTFSLDALAYTWQEQERLMVHWKSVLRVPIMDVVYEDLVGDFETTAKSLLEFCGLEWDDALRAYYLSSNECYTASYAQVRKPIYNSSVNRWHRYKPYIQPLIDRLAERYSLI